MYIGDMDEDEIVEAINEEAIDDEDLIDSWPYICTVRGRHYNRVDAIAWSSLCARRGYVLSRRNRY